MLFMCHALLTHLICLKSTTLKHTHVWLGNIRNVPLGDATTCCMRYKYSDMIIKNIRQTPIFMHT